MWTVSTFLAKIAKHGEEHHIGTVGLPFFVKCSGWMLLNWLYPTKTLATKRRFNSP